MSHTHLRFPHFHGGLRLQGFKSQSTRSPVRDMPLVARYYLPLLQHMGQPAIARVAAGDTVRRGETIASAADGISAAVHATTSGRIIGIEDRPVPHPSGMHAPCIVIEADGDDRAMEHPAGITDYINAAPADLLQNICGSGIVGLGGAAFPTCVKAGSGQASDIKTLIINGAECEPYITCDDMLMRTQATEVVAGARILMRLLGAEKCIIGSEDCQTEANAALEAALEAGDAQDIDLVEVPTVYPAGGERQLIRALIGVEVPTKGLPPDIGVVCNNVATAVAVHAAVTRNEPLTSRIVTVTGEGISESCNVNVRIGTPVHEIIDFCGGYTERFEYLIMGGPMMGFRLHSDQVPSVKAMNCLLAAARYELSPAQPEVPCIRCGECERVCPANLLPQQLYWYTRAANFEQVEKHHIFDCIECGCCSYVCPSNIPLVDYYRYAKGEIRTREDERHKSDIARDRHAAHDARLAREKAERAARHARKKAALAKQSPAEQ